MIKSIGIIKLHYKALGVIIQDVGIYGITKETMISIMIWKRCVNLKIVRKTNAKS